jgi:hypothetical protein
MAANRIGNEGPCKSRLPDVNTNHRGQLAMIKEVFDLFDTDGQHQLDEEELALAIYTLGFSQNRHVQVGGLPCAAVANGRTTHGAVEDALEVD